MLLLPAISGGFSRQLFKDGERTLILSSCQICGEARIGSSYGGTLQEWESDHACFERRLLPVLWQRSRFVRRDAIEGHT